MSVNCILRNIPFLHALLLIAIVIAAHGSCSAPAHSRSSNNDNAQNDESASSADASPATATVREHPPHTLIGPLRAVSWATPAEGVQHIVPMIWIRRNTSPVDAARASRDAPEGMAALFMWQLPNDIFRHPDDHVRLPDGRQTTIPGMWFDHGIAVVKRRMEMFYEAFHAAGGHADWLVLDYEGGRSIWHYDAETREHSIQFVLKDPRSGDLRATLKEFGIDESDFARIHNAPEDRPRYRLGEDLSEHLRSANPAYAAWNAIAERRVIRALEQAILEPIRKHYPHVIASNYSNYIMSREHIVPDKNAHLHYWFTQFGTHGAKAFYGSIGNLARMRRANGTRYGDEPFDILRWHVNDVRGIIRSSAVPFHAWVSHKNWHGSKFRNNGYYEELIYHLALNGVDDFIYWNPNSWRPDQNPAHWRTDEADRTFDQLLDELNTKLGTGQRIPITLNEMSWDSELIVSGMRIDDGRIIWRVTAPPGTDSIRVLPDDVHLPLDGHPGIWYESDDKSSPQFESVRASHFTEPGRN